MSASADARGHARAAAAFAVVAVRQGLPLESADILPTIIPAKFNPEPDVLRTQIASASARLNQAEADAWLDALPDPAAVAKFTALATTAGALCISDGKEGKSAGGDSQQDALYTMWLIARVLDYDEPEARGRWIMQRVMAALEILVQDGEAAWDRVRAELEQRGRLTGDEVRALVAESDAQSK